ncbi:MAG: GGDEF domain-containing protein [Planctomycetota bacterium]|jgi:diguanylate cyclase (GGDEF)-like protein
MNGRHVLIIDPDAELTSAVADRLRAKGAEVAVVDQAAAVPPALLVQQPDVVVVARSLPDGDGGLVRDLLAAQGISVAVIDLVDADQDERECGLAGPTAVTLVKPVAPDVVAEAVERLLNTKAADEGHGPRVVCRALIIDDEEDHCAMIEECFSRGGREPVEMVAVHTVEDACRVLEREEFDFVLLDHNLPDGTGCDVLERMEEQLLTTPVIGLSTSGDPNVALADFRGGALEFIQKHDAFSGDRLRQRVFEVLANYKRRIMASVIERRRRQYGIEQSDEELIAAARTDAMLQIFNRAAFEDVHADLHARASSEGRRYGLCLVDVDNFKRYNDHYGHASGDEVLRQVARALSAAIRPEDFVARYGGEEMVVLLEADTEDGVAVAARRLCDSVWRLGLPHEFNAEHGRITVSAGAAVFDPASREGASAVIERADAALYKAKAAGRNTSIVADGPAGSGALGEAA